MSLHISLVSHFDTAEATPGTWLLLLPYWGFFFFFYNSIESFRQHLGAPTAGTAYGEEMAHPFASFLFTVLVKKL